MPPEDERDFSGPGADAHDAVGQDQPAGPARRPHADETGPTKSGQVPLEGPSAVENLPANSPISEEAAERAGLTPHRKGGDPHGDDFDNAAHHTGAAALALRRLGKNKKLWFGFGGGFGIIAIIVAAFFALAPLKLEHLIKNELQQRVTNKAEFMMEKRADKLIIRYLFDRAGVRTGSGIAIQSSLVKTLWANWRLGQFEDKFYKQSGIKIEKNPDGRGVRLTAPNGVDESFADADKFESYIRQGTLKGADVRRFFHDASKSVTKWNQIYQRRNLRRFFYSAYGIRKWSWFTGKEGDAGAQEVAQDAIDDGLGTASDNSANVVQCMESDTNCAVDSSDPEHPIDTAGSTGDTPHAASTAQDSTRVDNVKSAFKDTIDKAKQYSPSKLAEKGLYSVLSKFLDDALAKEIAGKAAPVVGQILMIDQMARLYHFFDSGKADHVIANVHKIEYAKFFAQMISKDSNMRDPNGKKSSTEIGQTMGTLNGVETSAAYHDLFVHDGGGQKLDPSLGVSDTGSPIKDSFVKYGDTLGLAVSGPLRAWYVAVDKNPILGTLITKVGDGTGIVGSAAMSAIESIFPPLKSLMATIGDAIGKLMYPLIKPAVTGFESGPELMNAMDAGASVSGEQFAASLGGHLLSAASSAQLQQDIAANIYQDQAPRSLRDRLFSTDYDNSAINRLAMLVPTSLNAAVSQTTTYMMAVMRNPLDLFAHTAIAFAQPSYASSTTNIYGLNEYGCTSAELDQPTDTAALEYAAQKAAARLGTTPDKLSPNDVEMSDLPPVPAGQCDLGRADLQTIQALNPEFTNADDGGIGGSTQNSGDCSSGGGSAPGGSAYVMGDSIMVGAQGAGLADKLKADNFNDVTIDASKNRSITRPGDDGLSGMQAVEKDSAAVSAAQTIIINLGANQDSNFKQTAQGLIDKVNSINKNKPTIYWVNIVSKSDPAAYASENQALSQLQRDNKITVIDAAGQSIPLSPDSIHPTSDGYTKYATYIANQVQGPSGGGSSQACPGGVLPTSDYIFPINAPVVPPTSWTNDQGVDISTVNAACGTAAPEVAIADGQVAQIGISGFGDWAPVIKATSGPFKGRYIYYGHAKPNTVQVGDTVHAGQVIAYVGCGIVGLSSGPHIEIGVSTSSGPPCCPANGQTAPEMRSYLEKAYQAGHK